MADDASKGDESKQVWQLSPLAFRSRDERVAEIQREQFFENDRSELQWRRVRDLLLKPNGTAANAAILFHADAGVGKTESLKHFAERIEEERALARQAGTHCLLKSPMCFSLVHCSDDLTFVNCLSGGIFQVPKKKGLIRKHIEQIVEAWNQAKAGPLFLDEISDLAKGKAGDQDACCMTLRLVLNDFKGQVVATSNNDAREVFAADPNLATRFDIVSMPVWAANDALKDFLQQSFDVLPLRHAPQFSVADWLALLALIVNKTGGITRPMMKFVHRAAIYAIDSGIECMCLKVFLECDDDRMLSKLVYS